MNPECEASTDIPLLARPRAVDPEDSTRLQDWQGVSICVCGLDMPFIKTSAKQNTRPNINLCTSFLEKQNCLVLNYKLKAEI